jgi:hypothetical protein
LGYCPIWNFMICIIEQVKELFCEIVDLYLVGRVNVNV